MAVESGARPAKMSSPYAGRTSDTATTDAITSFRSSGIGWRSQ
jgi:hypothetical protein